MNFQDMNKDFYYDNSIDRNPLEKSMERFYPECQELGKFLPALAGAIKAAKPVLAAGKAVGKIAGQIGEGISKGEQKKSSDKIEKSSDLEKLRQANLSILSVIGGQV